MNLFNRARLSISRNLGRFLLMLGTVFLLSLLMSSAISINQAIYNLDLALRAQLPAVATLAIDEDERMAHLESTGEFLETNVTPTIMREIGALPYVQSFDYTAWGFNFFSSEYRRAFDVSMLEDRGSLSYSYDTPLEQFTLKGVHYPNVLDIETGLIKLVDGRTFSEEEILELSDVAIVSQDFLNANSLSLGSILTFEYIIYDETAELTFSLPKTDDHILNLRTFNLEIIGVFKKEQVVNAELHEIQHYFDFVNRIYVPNAVIESIVPLYMEVLPQIDPEFYLEISLVEDFEDILGYDDFLFLLNDPVNLTAFSSAANEILPDFWVVEDLSSTYADISRSMDMMNEIADGLLIGTVIATWVILGLLVLLFLIDRKQEIGVYLALGEKKCRILIQFMVEVLLVSAVGMTLGLFAGHMLSNQMSQMMIEQDVIRQLEDSNRVVTFGLLYGMGFRVDMTHEEMLALYEVSLNTTTIVLFYTVTLGTVLVATVIPTWSVVRKNPKDVLMKSVIG